MLLLVWLTYFATHLYGHVALKFASSEVSMWQVLVSGWGLSAIASWLISGVAWTFVLSKQSLLTANTVSALTYVQIALAALFVFGEDLTVGKFMGILCVCGGIFLVTQ
ncbi:MAG: hypothetical protein AAF702_45065 [Chloroflexota bacterium]